MATCLLSTMALGLALDGCAGDAVKPMDAGPDGSPSDTADGGGVERDAQSVPDSSFPPVQHDGGHLEGGQLTEVCDGVDNDGNGIIDDRDVEGDGVCDCLAIAYLGTPTGAKQGDVFADWLDARSDFGAVSLSGIEATELAKYDVLVVQNLGLLGTTYTSAELDALVQWVQSGGGLLTLTGYGTLTEPSSVNAILARFGLSYRPPLVLLSPSGTEGTLAVTGWTHPHPVTEGISAVGFNHGYPVDGDGDALATEMGHVVLRAKQVGEGHVLAWGDEWITFDSEWTAHPDYQVERLWQNMIKWLTRTQVCQVPILF